MSVRYVHMRPPSLTDSPTHLPALLPLATSSPPNSASSSLSSSAESEFARFSPKTLCLIDGADPVTIGRASAKRGSGRTDELDNGFLTVPRGKTALGSQHAMVCVRNGVLYIAMKERDGLILNDAGEGHARLLNPFSEFYPLESNSRVRLGVNGATSVPFLVDIIFEIDESDVWSGVSKKRFIRPLPTSPGP
ncbi:unnamed protein product [Mycena citricolor]|uniref:FHA domain-containing protein n=1 Tax=Mycena citricolor TaxID=2018698 RepID=A0AAD2JWU4_9AGAR|nr:unnamed protein product [Mycena citricolor]CAK5276992.1 unnamed protein product [Mycena citricolor]